ncbi:DNA polymerase III subunit gamma/tau [Patescibacteria group bacterium]|nr:DNA polymerase III subunit gamma/tau [Patescibacteria group bacterium]
MYYRKYRPQKFSEISKPNETAVALATQLKTNKTVHAYLFIGPRGTGKTTTARILAKALNCTNLEKTGDPCNECPNCLSITAGNFIDLIEIDAASNRGIDDIRLLKERINLAPASGKKKIYIIDEVHMLTQEAFNALLKTLEEPPSHAIFILCTTESHKVPETIKSRCQTFAFKRATLDQLTVRLKEIAKKEGAKITDENLAHLAASSQGGFRDAETSLQQLIEGGMDIKSLGSTQVADYHVFVESLLNNDASSAIHQINSLYEFGTDLFVWTGGLLKYLRSLLLLVATTQESAAEYSPEFAEKMVSQAKRLPEALIVFILEETAAAQLKLKNSFIPQLPLELLVVKICGFGKSSTSTIPITKPPIIPKTPKLPVPDKSLPVAVAPEVKDDLPAEDEPAIEDIQTFSGVGLIEVDVLKDSWVVFITKVGVINSSISALLRTTLPVAVDGHFVSLEVPFDFHKERLESVKNRKIVEDTLKDFFELELKIRCVVTKREGSRLKNKETGKLTDMNIMVPSGVQNDSGSLIDMFDGALPL